jgi:hypothetical protein
MTSKHLLRGLVGGLATEAITVGLFYYCARPGYDFHNMLCAVTWFMHLPTVLLMVMLPLPEAMGMAAGFTFEATLWSIAWWVAISIFARARSPITTLSLSKEEFSGDRCRREPERTDQADPRVLTE